MAYNISLEKVGDGISSIANKGNNLICKSDFSSLFYYFLLPLLIMLFIVLLLKYKDAIKEMILRIYAKRGYIRIHFILPNKRIKPKLIKLDKFNNFNVGKRKFSLDMMYDFIIGYDKYNFPVFMYDYNFILPLKITKEKITSLIKTQMEKSGLPISEQTVSAISLKIDSEILRTVYDRKLMSDLYSISKSNEMTKYLIWAGIGLAVFLALYYTGYLEVILSYVGIEV